MNTCNGCKQPFKKDDYQTSCSDCGKPTCRLCMYGLKSYNRCKSCYNAFFQNFIGLEHGANKTENTEMKKTEN